jgi:hypothetical protein
MIDTGQYAVYGALIEAAQHMAAASPVAAAPRFGNLTGATIAPLATTT